MSFFSLSFSLASFSFKRDCKSSLSISGSLVLPRSCKNYNYLFRNQCKNVNEKLKQTNSRDFRIFQIASVQLIGASYYLNYKETLTLIILAFYQFNFTDVGCNGRVSDSDLFRNTVLSKFIQKRFWHPTRNTC